MKKLNKEWAEALERSGFIDIEDSQGRLKDYHSTNWNNAGAAFQMSMTQAYYDRAMEIFRRHKFKGPKEKMIWMLHAKGWTYRRIVEASARWFIKPISLGAVHNVIRGVSVETGLHHE